jgi:hypothetical protein
MFAELNRRGEEIDTINEASISINQDWSCINEALNCINEALNSVNEALKSGQGGFCIKVIGLSPICKFLNPPLQRFWFEV